MKVYCGRNRKGKWKASLNRDNISKFQDIFETDIPQINGNRVWMIKLYKGFDYNYNSGTMYDDIAYSHKLYHSVSAAKKTELWKEYLNIAKTDPKNHFVSDFYIASNDGMDQPFVYGDIMEGKFNIEIFPVNVISNKDNPFKLGDKVVLKDANYPGTIVGTIIFNIDISKVKVDWETVSNERWEEIIDVSKLKRWEDI